MWGFQSAHPLLTESVCSEIKAFPAAQHVVRICIQHFIIKDFSGHSGTQNAEPRLRLRLPLDGECVPFWIIYVLVVWYGNSEHDFFSPLDVLSFRQDHPSQLWPSVTESEVRITDDGFHLFKFGSYKAWTLYFSHIFSYL